MADFVLRLQKFEQKPNWNKNQGQKANLSSISPFRSLQSFPFCWSPFVAPCLGEGDQILTGKPSSSVRAKLEFRVTHGLQVGTLNRQGITPALVWRLFSSEPECSLMDEGVKTDGLVQSQEPTVGRENWLPKAPHLHTSKHTLALTNTRRVKYLTV